MSSRANFVGDEITIRADKLELAAFYNVPRDSRGLVIFAHGSGSGRFSSRNHFVAKYLADAKLATLLLDLLTPAEDAIDQRTSEYRFDIPLLAQRLIIATDWAAKDAEASSLSLSFFGASTGAAAALIAAAERRATVRAVVSRGGRPDLAGDALALVRAPVLLIVGSYDEQVLQLNRAAAARLTCKNDIVIIPGASHLFEEPGTLQQAAMAARDWFLKYSRA